MQKGDRNASAVAATATAPAGYKTGIFPIFPGRYSVEEKRMKPTEKRRIPRKQLPHRRHEEGKPVHRVKGQINHFAREPGTVRRLDIRNLLHDFADVEILIVRNDVRAALGGRGLHHEREGIAEILHINRMIERLPFAEERESMVVLNKEKIPRFGTPAYEKFDISFNTAQNIHIVNQETK